MGKYAKETTVSVEKSRAEVERILNRYGADSFVCGWEGPRHVIRFKAHGKYIQFELVLPDKNSEEFTMSRHKRDYDRYRVDDATALKRWEQGCRQRWRALCLVIKAKLEAVDSGITTFEVEFLPHILLPDGQTASSWLLPQIDKIYESGQMPRALLPETFTEEKTQ